MPSILITGANRGIGKRLAELHDADGWSVISASRDPANCNAPGEKIALDVTDDASVAAAAETLSGRPIDVLWNNAGVYLDKNVPLNELDLEKWEETFRVNTIGPIRLARALMDNVARSDRKVLAFTTSRMGSIAQLSSGAYAYRSSKTALNMAVSVLTKDVAPQGIMTVLLHPGWVQTDMGGGAADIDADTSAAGMKSIVEELDPSQSGKFLNYDGKEFPW
ncbi:SDR family oxidoreductase [Pacificispira sp.]|uniref:SDR family oxidoreductase n=1 Tax=Pacificispira sp. TaxID=2888761 RepID=UPI003B521FA9